MLSEKVMLLGKGLYETIPDEIVITSIPTASELEYVGAEDFDRTIMEKILPAVVENSDDMNFNELLDVDYDWICRCLRMKSYGPYFTVNRIFCPSCNEISHGEYTADLRNVAVKVLPDGFVNSLTIEPNEFINFNERIHLHMLTAGEALTMNSDHAFERKDGTTNFTLAQLCYSITGFGEKKDLNPLEVRAKIRQSFDAADYELLKDAVKEKTDYGLRMSGSIKCPKCGASDAYFIAYQSDKFFRPSVGNIKEWKSAIRRGEWEGLLGDPSEYVRSDNQRDSVRGESVGGSDLV